MAELTDMQASCRFNHRINSALANGFLGIAVGASAITTIAVAANALPTVATAALAALPGICVGVLNVFRFHERAVWWAEMSVELNALIRALRDKHEAPEKISSQLSDFQRTHNAKYPGLGNPPT